MKWYEYLMGLIAVVAIIGAIVAGCGALSVNAEKWSPYPDGSEAIVIEAQGNMNLLVNKGAPVAAWELQDRPVTITIIRPDGTTMTFTGQTGSATVRQESGFKYVRVSID